MVEIKLGNGTRIAVIGGGIIGCLTALYLHRLGARPFILERGQAGQESSWAVAGILCPIHPWLYPDSFTRLIDYSLALYPALAEQLQADTGVSIQWSPCGLMIPIFAGDVIHHKQQALAWSQRFGWPMESSVKQMLYCWLPRNELRRGYSMQKLNGNGWVSAPAPPMAYRISAR